MRVELGRGSEGALTWVIPPIVTSAPDDLRRISVGSVTTPFLDGPTTA